MKTATIFVISGGQGASGERLAQTALAQFENVDVQVIIRPQIQSVEALEAAVLEASKANAIVLHTLVDSFMRNKLIDLTALYRVVQLDLIGGLLDQLTHQFGQRPLEQPGLYRKLREQDIRRIEAIEFTIDHDDGKRIHDLAEAEIVLTGVSRVGKTPLSVYLSTLGWKVANVPLVKDIEPPQKLFEIERSRVVGLTVEPSRLIAHRTQRGQHLGAVPLSSYSSLEAVQTELEFAESIFRHGRFPVVNMTDKPIEECAQEIMSCLRRH